MTGSGRYVFLMSSSRRDKVDKSSNQPHDIADVFKALSDPTRVRILIDLGKNDACVHELSSSLDMTQTSISHHLRQLRGQKLVTTRRTGREIYYGLASNQIIGIIEAAKRHVESD
jgi:ArsR family transcriptional regulator, lead/cadmium/zinc/bismuth-responsive transcriptional repressor